MKIWNTKYCLTDGITEHDVEQCNDTMVRIPKSDKGYEVFLHGEGKEWHRSLESAVYRANEVKIKKLQSLDKQVKRIGAIEFGN